MTMMRSGALRHRVDLESATTIPDGGGGDSVNWEIVASLWVAIKPLRGHETLEAGQYASRLTHEFTLRYRDQLLPQMRFRKGNRIFHIQTVSDVDEQKRWLRVLCEEREL